MSGKKKTALKSGKNKKNKGKSGLVARKKTRAKVVKKVGKPARKSVKAARKVASPKKKQARAPAKATHKAKKATKPARKLPKPVEKVSAKPRKAPAKKKAVKGAKSAVRKKSAAKAARSKSVKPAVSVGLPPPRSRPGSVTPHKKKSKPEKKLSAKELREFRQMLLNLRDQVVDGISFLSGDNLNRSQRDASGDLSGYSLHMADQGTDNYDREFALNLVSSEQDILYEIDEAIRRIDTGKYGICEMTGDQIERARLKALPHARFSVSAQSEMERGRTRYRPFGPTLSHGG